MKKRVLAGLCGLMLSIALVGLVLGGVARATLLDEDNAVQAMQKSGFVGARTELIRETLAGFFTGAGLDGGPIAAAVGEGAVETSLNHSVQNLLLGSPTGVTLTDGMFAAVGQEAIISLESDGSTVTAEGREQVEHLVLLSEGVYAELTIAPMANVIVSLSGLLGQSNGVASIILCAALAVLAVCGIVWAAHRQKTVGLYLSSALLGSGLALLVPALVLDGRRAAMSAVMREYFAPFYGLLATMGAVLGALGLLYTIANLVLARKRA